MATPPRTKNRTDIIFSKPIERIRDFYPDSILSGTEESIDYQFCLWIMNVLPHLNAERGTVECVADQIQNAQSPASTRAEFLRAGWMGTGATMLPLASLPKSLSHEGDSAEG